MRFSRTDFYLVTIIPHLNSRPTVRGGRLNHRGFIELNPHLSSHMMDENNGYTIAFCRTSAYDILDALNQCAI